MFSVPIERPGVTRTPDRWRAAATHGGPPQVIITSPRRLGALALAAAFTVGACSGSASPSPAASAAPGASAAASAGVAGPAAPSGDVSLAGAGATFPGPLYQVWVEKYAAVPPNVKIDYQAIGSGGGIKNITAQTVDFGASDAAMKDAEIAALPAGTKILHIPTALGAVVFIYNLPGVTELNLDGPTAADIFLGTIKKWNDPKIAALNAGATLPGTDIVVVHRSDGSGTTNAFTTYLGAVSDAWKNGPGVGKDVKWPTGIGATGNDGVAGRRQADAGRHRLRRAQLRDPGGAPHREAEERGRRVRGRLRRRRDRRRGRIRGQLPGGLPGRTHHQRRRGRHLSPVSY